MLAQAQNLKLPQTKVIATQLRSQQFCFEQVWTPGIGHSMPIFPGVVVHLHRLQAPPPRGGVTADKPAKEQVKTRGKKTKCQLSRRNFSVIKFPPAITWFRQRARWCGHADLKKQLMWSLGKKRKLTTGWVPRDARGQVTDQMCKPTLDKLTTCSMIYGYTITYYHHWKINTKGNLQEEGNLYPVGLSTSPELPLPLMASVVW